MASRAAANGPAVAPSAEKVYEETIASIRATDDISFKLLGLVPLVSGTAIATLLLKDAPRDPSLIVLFSLFAAAVTLGLFRWELRNVQECSRLLRYAEVLAARALEESDVPKSVQNRPLPPQRIGKTEAEKLIYGATIAAWLALPIAVGAVEIPGTRSDVLIPPSSQAIVYVAIASVILFGAIVSLFARTRLPRTELSDDRSAEHGRDEAAAPNGETPTPRETVEATTPIPVR